MVSSGKENGFVGFRPSNRSPADMPWAAKPPPGSRLKSTVAPVQLSTTRFGTFPIAAIDWTKRRKGMTDWKTDLDALVFETMAFAKTNHRERLPADLTERPILQPMNWGGPQREDAERRKFARVRADK
jgi:hypothetical protein